MKEDLFDKAAYQNCLDRINKITPTTTAQWGKMDSAQMMAHCAIIQETMNGTALKSPWFIKLFRNYIKKIVIKGEYKKGTATHPAYKQEGSKEFETEKQRLLNAMDSFVTTGPEKAATIPHSLFGKMTAEEKGRAMYKHLAHHLTQFGV